MSSALCISFQTRLHWVSAKRGCGKLAEHYDAAHFRRGAKTRASLSKNINVQDKVGRSAGVLKNARLLSCDEYMKLISNVRFGIAEKLLSGITLEDIHTLTVAVQPATMAAAHGSNLSAGQRDILRADEVRKALKALQ